MIFIKKSRFSILWFFFLFSVAFSQEDELSFSLERQETKSTVILRSIKKLPCKNYKFDTRDYQNADTIIIIVRDFLAPTPCNGPRAIAEDKLTLTPPAKRFYLKFWYKGKYDKWRIFQHDTAYFVRPEGISFSTYSELEK